MKTSALALMTLLLFSCGKKSEDVELVEVKAEAFSPYINDKNMPSTPNLSLDKYLVDNTYPIALSLYKDQKFYYDLPNLGDGTGTWSYSEGRIELRAELELFDMYIELYTADAAAKRILIRFRDRHGRNTIKMIKQNIGP